METRLVNMARPSGRVHLSLTNAPGSGAADTKHGDQLPSYYVTIAKRDVPSGKQPCSKCAK